MSRDEAAALDALRRWLGGEDAALEEWLEGPAPPTGRTRLAGRVGEPAEGPDADRVFLRRPDHREALV